MKKVINSFIVIGLSVLVLSVCSCFGKSKKLTKENLPTLVGRYSELCMVDSGGYNSHLQIERIALEITKDRSYCFTIIDGNKNGIRSRGKISIEKILTDSLLAIHRVNAYTDEYRNLSYKKAYVCLLHPDGLGIQHNWQPDKGVFDSEIMTDSFWEAPAAIQKMVQKDIPLEVILVFSESLDSPVIKINRNRKDFLLEKDNKRIDDENEYRMAERSCLRGL